MRGLKRLIFGILLLVLVMVAVAFALPNQVSVERSTVINSLEADIFPYLNNLKKFNSWSPWAARDPETHYVFTGPVRGKGARMEWDSDTVGTGTMEITATELNKSVMVALDFGVQGKANARYRLSPSGAGTRVTWGFETEVGNNPLKRWMSLLFDRWIGKDYEEGLANLKKVVEAEGVGR